ncbi:MAG: hypothetical protein Q4F02_03715 [Candidatus Saccharibacteria bacterium]|nr:hypothetical protein [Candidatus Saccharibacteria bacterium]
MNKQLPIRIPRWIAFFLLFFAVLGAHILLWHFLWDTIGRLFGVFATPTLASVVSVFLFRVSISGEEYRLRDALVLCIILLLAQIIGLAISLALLLPGDQPTSFAELFSRAWEVMRPELWWSYWETKPRIIGAFIISCITSICTAVSLWYAEHFWGVGES